MPTYDQVCVWVVTAAGTVVIVAFACYFCATVWRLVKTQHQPVPVITVAAPERLTTPATGAFTTITPCQHELGPVIKAIAGDDATLVLAVCKKCQAQVWTERKPDET